MEWTKEKAIEFKGNISHCSLYVKMDKRELISLLDKLVELYDESKEIHKPTTIGFPPNYILGECPNGL